MTTIVSDNSIPLTLAVASKPTTGSSAWGETLVFDFSSQVPQGGSVLAYGVGLAGFNFNYVTNGQVDQNFGLMQNTLIPVQMENVINVTVAASIADFDNDAPADFGSVSNSETYTQVTVVALIGQTNTNVVMGNIYGVSGGSAANGVLPVQIGSNSTNNVFLSGFQVQTASPGVLTGFSASCNLAGPPQNGQLNLSTSTWVGDRAISGSVDALVLSFPSSGNDAPANYEIVYPSSISWDSPNSEYGYITGTFSVSFSKAVTNAAVLLQDFSMSFSDNESWDFCTSGVITSLSWSDGSEVVNGTITINFFASEAWYDNYPSSNSSATIAVIAQF